MLHSVQGSGGNGVPAVLVPPMETPTVPTVGNNFITWATSHRQCWIHLTNTNLSILLPYGVRSALLGLKPTIAAVLPGMVTAEPANWEFLEPEAVMTVVWKTNLLGLGAMLLFGGVDVFKRPEVLNTYERELATWGAPKTFFRRGLMGLIKRVRLRNPGEIGWLGAMRKFLQSRPLHRGLRALVETAVSVRSVFMKRKQKHSGGAAVEKPEAAAVEHAMASARTYLRYAQWLPTTWTANVVDAALTIIGDGLPAEHGRPSGFAYDVVGNGLTGIGNAKFLNPTNTFEELLWPQMVIAPTVAYANTSMTQRLSHVQQFVHRTIVGILRSGAYTGVCSAEVFSKWAMITIQAIYGVFANIYAYFATKDRTKEEEGAEQYRKRMETRLAYWEGRIH